MNKHLLDKLKSLLQRRQLKEKLAKAAMVMSCLVVFMVTYMLVAPVLTQEWEPQCGLEEHIHTDECYELVPVEPLEDEDAPAAEPETADSHHHTEECYTETTKLVCEVEEHSHSEGCYDEEGNLICGKEEHTHTEECEETTRELTCGLEETAEDAESEAPAEPKMEKVLICGKEEHEHSDLCYHLEEAKGPEYICGYPEEHKHTESCYFEDGTLKCTLTEHIHDDTCLVEDGQVENEEEPTEEVVEDPVLDEEFLLEANGFEDLDAALFAEGGTLPWDAFNAQSDNIGGGTRNNDVFITLLTNVYETGYHFPDEPSLVSVGEGKFNFLFLNTHYGERSPQLWGVAYWNGDAAYYHRGDPKAIINENAFKNGGYTQGDRYTDSSWGGISDIWGISDPTGDLFIGTNDPVLTLGSDFFGPNGSFMETIVWDNTKKATDAEKIRSIDKDGNLVPITDANKDQFKIVPYVVKYQNGNIDHGWHIDCALVPSESKTFNISFEVEWQTDDKRNVTLDLLESEVVKAGYQVEMSTDGKLFQSGGEVTETGNEIVRKTGNFQGIYQRAFIADDSDYNMSLNGLPDNEGYTCTKIEPRKDENGNYILDEYGNLHFKFVITKDAPEPQTVDFIFQKTDVGGHPLPGAAFALYQDPACETEIAAGTSDENGCVAFHDLTVEAEGTAYYLKETNSPEGYRLLDAVFKVTLSNTGAAVAASSDGADSYLTAPGAASQSEYYQIKNESIYIAELPATGGSGTTLLYTAGAALVLTSALLMYNVWNPRKRKGEAA